MITINKGQVNKVVVTLREKTTLSTVYYLMELFWNQGKSTKVVNMSTNISSNISRWDEFGIEENTIEDLLNGIVSLEVGTYDYYIHQSSTNVDNLSGAEGIVESGKLVVIGDEDVKDSYNDQKTKVVYNG